MKKHLSILFCLAVIFSACSDEDTPEGDSVQAEEKNPVERLVDDYYHSLSDARSSETPEITSVSRRSYQIVGDTVVAVEDGAVSRSANDSIFELATVEFTVAGQEGYAVLSDDPRLNRVFLFTDNGCLSDTSEIWGLKYAINLTPHVAASFIDRQEEETLPASRSGIEIGYVVRFKWGQGYPFNIFAPECNCSTCSRPDRKWRNPIGCVATAVAQAIATVGKFKSTYYGSRNIDFSKLPVYGPTGPSATTPYVTELAHFLHEVAVCCQMKFGCGGSSTSAKAAYQYLLDLGYKCDYVENGGVDFAKLINNLSHGRPHLMAGSDGTNGHMWIVDGIKTIGGVYEYHCNWGWNGSSDGWWTDYWTPKNHPSYTKSLRHVYINGTN